MFTMNDLTTDFRIGVALNLDPGVDQYTCKKGNRIISGLFVSSRKTNSNVSTSSDVKKLYISCS